MVRIIQLFDWDRIQCAYDRNAPDTVYGEANGPDSFIPTIETMRKRLKERKKKKTPPIDGIHNRRKRKMT